MAIAATTCGVQADAGSSTQDRPAAYPDELQNFAKDPEYEDVLTQLRQRNDALKAEYETAGDGWLP